MRWVVLVLTVLAAPRMFDRSEFRGQARRHLETGVGLDFDRRRRPERFSVWLESGRSAYLFERRQNDGVDLS